MIEQCELVLSRYDYKIFLLPILTKYIYYHIFELKRFEYSAVQKLRLLLKQFSSSNLQESERRTHSQIFHFHSKIFINHNQRS